MDAIELSIVINRSADISGYTSFVARTELEHSQEILSELLELMEAYESFSEIKTFNIDLHKHYQEIFEARCIVLEEEDADFIFQIAFPTPPSVTWEWIHNPEKRNIRGGVPDAWSAGDRPQGRSGVGSRYRCAHGNSVSTQVLVDWHPFEYYTTHSLKNGKHTFTETLRFEALPDGGTCQCRVSSEELSSSLCSSTNTTTTNGSPALRNWPKKNSPKPKAIMRLWVQRTCRSSFKKEKEALIDITSLIHPD